METKIGIGVISFAHGYANAYCSQMQTFDDVELVACWDDNAERGEAAATQYGMNYSPHLEDVVNCHSGGWTRFGEDDFGGISFCTRGTARCVSTLTNLAFCQ